MHAFILEKNNPRIVPYVWTYEHLHEIGKSCQLEALKHAYTLIYIGTQYKTNVKNNKTSTYRNHMHIIKQIKNGEICGLITSMYIDE
jgi:hypothetical protein